MDSASAAQGVAAPDSAQAFIPRATSPLRPQEAEQDGSRQVGMGKSGPRQDGEGSHFPVLSALPESQISLPNNYPRRLGPSYGARGPFQTVAAELTTLHASRTGGPIWHTGGTIPDQTPCCLTMRSFSCPPSQVHRPWSLSRTLVERLVLELVRTDGVKPGSPLLTGLL